MELVENNIRIIDEGFTPEGSKIDFLTTPISSSDRLIHGAKSFVGYYLQILKMYMKDIDRQDILVDVFFNENNVNTKSSYILVTRGNVSPANLAVPGSTFTQFTDIGVQMTDGVNVNTNETMLGMSLIDQEMVVKIYSHNRAELEDISYKIYQLLLSLSDDVLGMVFSNVRRVMEPILTSIVPFKDYDDMFECSIQWNIYFIERSILLFKEKMIKYTNFIIQENSSKDEIKINKKDKE